MSSGKVNTTELVAALINQKDDFVSGIKHAQESIDGSLTLLIITQDGQIIAARDKVGRLPVLIGKSDDGFCISFESFAYHKLGYRDEYELGLSLIHICAAYSFRRLRYMPSSIRTFMST